MVLVIYLFIKKKKIGNSRNILFVRPVRPGFLKKLKQKKLR